VRKLRVGKKVVGVKVSLRGGQGITVRTGYIGKVTKKVKDVRMGKRRTKKITSRMTRGGRFVMD